MTDEEQTKTKKEFDYYIYIDYSENMIGYMIVEKNKIKDILPKISKLHHYKNIRYKREYISAIKKRFEKNKIREDLLKYEIKTLRNNAYIFSEVLDFVGKNNNCIIFVSVDNNQYGSFVRLFHLIPHKEHVIVVKESQLKKGTMEYQLSLIIDNLLNIERRLK